MTDKLTTIQSLRDRVENATGPEQALMFDLVRSTCVTRKVSILCDQDVVRVDWPEFAAFIDAKAWADAAMAWVKRILPKCDGCGPNEPASSGWRIGFYRGLNPACGWTAYIRQHGQDGFEADAQTAALAIILAGLDALIAKERENPDGTS